MKIRKKLGFTILEILVVLAIGALILSFVFWGYRDLKAKSRDSRREHDIKEIQNSLVLYVNEAGVFPCTGEGEIIIGVNSCLKDALLGIGVIPALPIDPLGGASGSCGNPASYVYCYQSLENGFNYQIRYNLETDSILGKAKGLQSVSP
ncbi:MAG: type II secretion system protein [Candidatus Niyogibacteria bacterium]|nr:type II secretion system protein [Candidatus Niyogibacteria bacterium]